MSTGIVWESPPDPTTAAGTRTGDVDLDILRGKPGVWARISEHGSAAAARAAMRRWREKTGPGFELTVRTVPAGGYLYCRFVGIDREYWTDDTRLSTTFSHGTRAEK